MDNIKKLSLPISIVLGCLILGSFYYTIQVRKGYLSNKISYSDEFSDCNYDKFSNNARVAGCLKDIKNNLLKERGNKFNDFLSMEHPRINTDNFMIPLKTVKETVSNWYKLTDSYREKYCEAEIINYSDGSGYFEGIEMCDIRLLKSDIKFLNERIKELEDHTKNLTPEETL